MPQNLSWKDIDAVCVLSPNDPERKKQFLNLKKTLPQLKTFPAIMGSNLTHKDIQSLLAKKILDKGSISFTHSGEIGCYLSHLQILKNFVLSQKKYCLIFEDDMRLEKNFTKHLKEALLECPENWDFLYLWAWPIQKKSCTFIKSKKYILKATRIGGSCAYVVNQKGAKKIVNNIQPMRAKVIDRHFGDLVNQNKLQAFITKKVITENLGVRQGSKLPTTIHNTSYLQFFPLKQFIFCFFYLGYFFLFCIPIKVVFNYWLPLSNYALKRFDFFAFFLMQTKSKIKKIFVFLKKK